MLTELLLISNLLAFFLVPADAKLAYVFTLSDFLAGDWYRALTSIFMHADIFHLLANSLALYFLGNVVERHIPASKYLLVYLLGGVMGNLILLLPLWDIPPEIPVLGASGAISALIGVGIFLCPWEQVLFAPFWLPLPFMLVGVLYLLSTLSGMLGPPTPIAYESHLAGLLIGMLFGLGWGKEREISFLIFLFLLTLLVLLPFIF
jgi:membrane associated rhomboid family serine protease